MKKICIFALIAVLILSNFVSCVDAYEKVQETVFESEIQETDAISEAPVLDFSCQHEWEEAACEKAKNCKKCGEIEGKALGHPVDKYDQCERCGADFGKWRVGEYVDEFDRPTGKKYLVTSVTGTFSNSATTNSELTVRVMYDEEGICLKMYEYSQYLVSSSSSTRRYSVRVLSPDNVTYDYGGILYSGGIVVSIQYKLPIDSSQLVRLFKNKSGTFIFYIKDEKYGDTYKFEVESSNFAKLYSKV